MPLLCLLALFFSCKTRQMFQVQESPTLDRQEIILSFPPPESSEAQPSTRSVVELDYVIDDFEHGIDRWTPVCTPFSHVDVTETECGGQGKSIRFAYTLKQKRQIGINPDQVGIRIHKNSRFEAFRGVEFLAKSDQVLKVRVVLYEFNQVTASISAQEIWGKEVLVGRKWQQYRIPFSAFEPEEYYEQGFIGDQNQQLQNVRDVGFMIDNREEHDQKSGELYIDNLYLF
jgi:hypothetical protein